MHLLEIDRVFTVVLWLDISQFGNPLIVTNGTDSNIDRIEVLY